MKKILYTLWIIFFLLLGVYIYLYLSLKGEEEIQGNFLVGMMASLCAILLVSVYLGIEFIYSKFSFFKQVTKLHKK